MPINQKPLPFHDHLSYKIHFPTAHTSSDVRNITKGKFEGRKVIGNGWIGIDMIDHKTDSY